MEDIPQPSPEPYKKGDLVRVYLSPNDLDQQHHNTVCIIVDVFSDDLDDETGRSLDQYSYRVRNIETEQVLQVQFRHHDLVPLTRSSEDID